MSRKRIEEKALPEGWREVKLGDACKFKRGPFGGSLKKEIFVQSGYAVYEQSHAIYSQFENIRYHIDKVKFEEMKGFQVRPGDLIMSCSGTMGKVAIVPQNVKPGIINQALLKLTTEPAISVEFLKFWMSSNEFQKSLASVTFGNAIKNVASVKILKELLLPLPPCPEQKAIAFLLETWDTAIEKTETLIAAKEKRFKWLLQTLIYGTQSKTDSISAFATEISSRNRNNVVDRVLSVTNHSGFVLPDTQFERRVASADLSNYKIISNGQYAYNPSRINVGSIARLDDWNVGVLSPMYIVFSLDENKIDSNYFLYWISSGEARQRIKNSAQGSVRETVSFGDLCVIPIPLPPITTQTRIAKVLNVARSEISLLQNLVVQYRTQEQGLMQKLLTGDWRTNNRQRGH